MTIIASMAIQGAFIFGSESRQVLGDENWSKSFQEKDYNNRNFGIQPGEFPKTFLVGNRYALNYSGPGFTHDWLFKTDLQELQQMAQSGRYTIFELANHFNDKLKNALKGHSFTFHLAGFPGGYPVLADSDDGVLMFYEGKEKTTAMNMVRFAGMVDIIEKLAKDELLDFERMTIKEAIEFVYLTITVGCKYLEYFKKYPEVSGGPVNILVVTPDKSEFYKVPAFSLSPRKGGLSV